MINSKRGISIFGTMKNTPETYLLTCVFNHFRPGENRVIQLTTHLVEPIRAAFPKYKDCFVYHEEPLYVSKKHGEYHWEFIPTKEFLIEYQDKLNTAFFKLSLSQRFNNGELVGEKFNYNKVVFNQNVKYNYHKNRNKMKSSFAEYYDRKSV